MNSSIIRTRVLYAPQNLGYEILKKILPCIIYTETLEFVVSKSQQINIVHFFYPVRTD